MSTNKTKKPAKSKLKLVTEPKIFQLKIELAHIAPPVWRRVLVQSEFDLGLLHEVIQVTFGWQNSHMHAFEVGERQIADVEFNEPGGRIFEDETRVLLDQVAGSGDSFNYEYDFGDGWNHQITVEAVLQPDRRFVYPLCTAGARACPPEDVGGPYGYEMFLEALADPKHQDHDLRTEWIGGVFDAEGFDLNVINAILHSPE